MRKKLNGRVLAGLVILSVVLLVALLAPVLAPHDPYELGVPYLRPSAEHPLGTNDIGQDILSELIYGTRISLLIGVVSALAVTVVGTALGILSGYLGGWTDQIIMQVTNVAMALPSDHHSGGLSGCQRVEHHPGHLHHRLDLYGPHHPQPGAAAQGSAFYTD